MHKNVMWLAAALTACASGDAPEVDTSSTNGNLVTIPTACDYPQIFGTPAHTGSVCPAQSGLHVIKKITQDPDADAENAFSGFLQIHESPPLTSGDFVVVPTRSGFTDGFNRQTDKYALSAYRWTNGVMDTSASNDLAAAWTVATDWQPTDGIIGSFGTFTNGYVMAFAPAIGNSSVYVPARAGKVKRVSLATGVTVATINPFAGTGFDGDERTIAINEFTVRDNGDLLYNVTAFNATANDISSQPRQSWLVIVHPDNTSRIVPWDTIATRAAGVTATPADKCSFRFSSNGITPTSSATPPIMGGCGTQRPAFNAPVTVSPLNGHLIVYTVANNGEGAAFLVELDPTTFAPIRAVDTRGHLLTGCGVRETDDDDSFCSLITDGFTTHIGFDGDFNEPTKIVGQDIMDDAPWAAPNGDIGVGGYDGGFSFGGGYDARGSSIAWPSTGTAVKAMNTDFAWEVTPSVFPHGDGSFSYLQDRNLYSDLSLQVAQYSSVFDVQTLGGEVLDFETNAVDYLDTNTLADTDDGHYGVNGTGHLDHFDATGKLTESVELDGDDGLVRSMETESGVGARDRAGRVLVSYAGSVYVVGGSSKTGTVQPHVVTPALRAGIAAKRHAAKHVTPRP